MACTPPTITVGGVILSTSDYVNAMPLVNNVSGDQGDPTLDEYNENIANGNNTANRTGVQIPIAPTGSIPTQTTLPTVSPIPGTDSNNKPPPGFPGVPGSSLTWTGNYDQQLSTNFKVRSFTVNAVFPYELTNYLSFTTNARFTAMAALATNVAEPLLAKFGALNINSGLRNKTSASSGISQHIKGEAIDIQFPGWNYQRYWENAQWVKDNIPYDQFIFEHSSSTGLAWYHLSYNRLGNRAATDPTKVMTMFRNHYDPGLQRHG
jgi:hypothetical protein